MSILSIFLMIMELEIVCITAKHTSYRKFYFTDFVQKFFHGHNYLWPPRLWRLLEPKKPPHKPKKHKGMNFLKNGFNKNCSMTSKPLSGLNQIWTMTSFRWARWTRTVTSAHTLALYTKTPHLNSRTRPKFLISISEYVHF